MNGVERNLKSDVQGQERQDDYQEENGGNLRDMIVNFVMNLKECQRDKVSLSFWLND